jgi:hypothetical protein
MGGVVVGSEGLWWSAHGGQGARRRRTRAVTADPGLGMKCEWERERNGGRGRY